MRNKLELEGKFTVLKEIEPKYFEYVIKWRNNPELNKYLNQNFTLTYDLEMKWYQEKYLSDETQGMLIALDKKTETPIGTYGWTDLDKDKKIVVTGRAMFGEQNLKYVLHVAEMFNLVDEYIMNFVDLEVTHIVLENTKAINYTVQRNYQKNQGKLYFPEYCSVNGMKLIEYTRTREQFEEYKAQLHKSFPKIF